MPTIALHGNCPHCRHWHNRTEIRVSPWQYRRVNCDRCKQHWFSLGGNSTHTSLLSQETRSENQDLGTSSLVLAICSNATTSMAVGAPSIRNTSTLNRPAAIQEDQDDHVSSAELEEVNELGQSAMPLASSNAGPMTSTSMPAAGGSNLMAEGPSDTLLFEESQLPEEDVTLSKRPPKSSKGIKRKLKKFLAYLGVDVQVQVPVQVSRIKRPSRAPHKHAQILTETSQQHQSPIGSESQRVEGLEIPAERSGHVPILKDSDSTRDDQQLFDHNSHEPVTETSHREQADAQEMIMPDDPDTLEKRKQKRRQKTIAAKEKSLKQHPIRCACSPDCHCKSSSLSSAHAVMSRSTPDVSINFNIDGTELEGQDRIDFDSGRLGPRSITPEVVHTGGSFPGNMAFPPELELSEDDRSRQTSHATTTTSHRPSDGNVVTESSRASTTHVVATAQSSAFDPSLRSPRRRSSGQDDPVIGHRATQWTH